MICESQVRLPKARGLECGEVADLPLLLATFLASEPYLAHLHCNQAQK
jgi:hypothetical protein